MFQDLLNKTQARKGMTLIEIAVSILIFGFIVISLSLPVYTGLQLLGDDDNFVRANNLAKSYMKNLEDKWKIQMEYDSAELIELDANYTNNEKYTVEVNTEDIRTTDDGIVTVRRVRVDYKNKKGQTLVNIFCDFNRPGVSVN